MPDFAYSTPFLDERLILAVFLCNNTGDLWSELLLSWFYLAVEMSITLVIQLGVIVIALVPMFR